MAYKFIVKVKSIKTSIQTKVLVSGTLDGIILNTSIQETLANQEIFWDLDNVIANTKRPTSTLFRFKVESAETGQTMVEFEEDLDNFILKLNGLLKKSFEMSKMTDDNHEEMCIVTLQIYVAKLSDEKFKSPTQQKGDIFPIRKVTKTRSTNKFKTPVRNELLHHDNIYSTVGKRQSKTTNQFNTLNFLKRTSSTPKRNDDIERSPLHSSDEMINTPVLPAHRLLHSLENTEIPRYKSLDSIPKFRHTLTEHILPSSIRSVKRILGGLFLSV